jgi:hypothetical protein
MTTGMIGRNLKEVIHWRSGNRALALLCGCVMALSLALSGCAAVGLTMTPQQRAQKIEPMLSAAGFRMLAANTPEKEQHLANLPPFKLHYYTNTEGKMRYWFADPAYCHCVYLGNEAAYQKYQNLHLQQQLAEQQQRAAQENYAASQQMQMDMLNPFGFGSGFAFGF